jgi:flagellar export protein FliJ
MRGRIDGIIRLQRWQLDEKRRNLAELEGMRQDFENRIAHLDAELEREKAIAAEGGDTNFRFSDFVAATIARKQSIQESILNIDKEIEAARDDVAEAFQELKKLETVDARQQQEKKNLRDRRQQTMLDEMAIMRHGRASAE